MINREHPLPITKQCLLLKLCRSGIYYASVPVSGKNRDLMRLIGKIHLEFPFLGSRGIRNELLNKGCTVGRSHPGHTIYPYLLRGLSITEGNAVWATDITYIPMAKGFCYLVAIMDWASRKVLSWKLSNTLDTSFCIEALEEAIFCYGTPQIFNSDQGSQFTSDAFTEILKNHNASISMDGRGRWMDNVFIERLWKSVKYEEVYLKAYSSIAEARKELAKYFDRYNQRRRHQGLDDRTPDMVYWDTIPKLKEAV
jgi:putative transposase